MGQTSLNSQDIRDGQVQTGDLANDSVNKDKLGIVGTKGDLITYTTEPAALVTGSVGQVLIVSGVAPEGIGWSSAPRLNGIFDTNGNLLLAFIGVANAVNYISFNNHSAGNSPGFTALGASTDINIRLIPKGTGKVKLGSSSYDAVDIGSVQTVDAKVLTNATLGSSTTSSIGTDGRVFPKIITWVLAIETDLTVGTDKTNSILIPYAGILKRVTGVAKTGPTGSSIIIDINKNGTSLWAGTPANRLTIADGGTQGSITDFDSTSTAADDIFTIDVDQVGSTVAGQTITVQLTMLVNNV